MSLIGYYYETFVLSGIVIDDEEVEFEDLDVRTYFTSSELVKIQPNRDPVLELDYLGLSDDVEFLFTFKSSWEDRSSDIQDYLDQVQEEIENQLPVQITDAEWVRRVPI